MSEEKKITVRLEKAGWKVEITCTEDQLQSAMESVLSSLTSSSPRQSVPFMEERPSEGSRSPALKASFKVRWRVFFPLSQVPLPRQSVPFMEERPSEGAKKTV